MNIEINDEKVNRLLHRTELHCTVSYDKVTPTRKEIVDAIAAKKGVKDSLVVVDCIRQEYGKKEASAYVKVYESEKTAGSVEQKHILERHVEKPKEKKEAAPAEEKKEAGEEKPAEAAEEKGEEKPAEEKKEAEPPVEEAKPPEEKKEEAAEEKKEE